MTEQDEHQTAVVFRKWVKRNGGGIIALFPEIPCDAYRYYCLSYQHVGQFSGADYNGVIARTGPAIEEEYADLKKE